MPGKLPQDMREWPPYLHAEPAPLPAREWHQTRHQELASLDSLGPWQVAAVAYHEAWLRALDAPGDPAAAIPVSVVIPAYNPGRFLQEALASSLAQTHPRIEIVIVDDGSDPAVAGTLGDLARQVRLVRQDNAGAAAARNRGIAEATGVLVHFLDADDYLRPDCIAEKIRALELVPDADLVFADYNVVGEHERSAAADHRRPPIGDEFCPSRGLLRAASRRFVFNVTTVLAARWMLLAAGPMPADLRMGEDGRYWFQLGMYGAKAIGVDLPLSTRRLRFEGLSSRRHDLLHWWAMVALLNAADLLAAPEHWRHFASQLARFRHKEIWALVCDPSESRLDAARHRFVSAIDDLPDVAGGAGRSVRPLLAIMRQFTKRAAAQDGGDTPFVGDLAGAVERLADAANPMTRADLDPWLDGALSPRERVFNAPATGAAARWLSSQLASGRRPVSRDELAALAAAWPELEWSRRWAATARRRRGWRKYEVPRTEW